MLYTQTSLSLVYNLERVSKNLHCYSATYQFGIVAWLRLEPKNYSTKPYSLHRRCSFGPVAVALGKLSESFVLSAAFLLLGVVCVALDLLLGVGGRQITRCRCVLVVQLWLRIWEWRYYPVPIRSWRCAAGAVLCGVSCALCDERGDVWDDDGDDDTCQLPDDSFIFTGELELHAILLALRHVYYSKQKSFLILSDSLSSLQAIHQTWSMTSLCQWRF